MSHRCMLAAIWIGLLATNVNVWGGELPTPAELSAKNHWVSQALLASDRPVVSFLYGGNSSAQLLPGWQKKPIEVKLLSKGRTQYVITWTDPATGLEVRIVSVDYSDYPAVEWIAYLKNKGPVPTPILEQVQGIDAKVCNATQQTLLRTNQGDFFSPSGYEPLEFKLDGHARTFQPKGGRSTNGAWPYFNIDNGRSGVIVALGWPGQWQSQFAREDGLVRARGGQQTIHLRLRPGEEIRTPLVAMLFWAGRDWIAGQNLWRRWFLAHNLPQADGKLPELFEAPASSGLHKSAAEEFDAINAYRQKGTKTGLWWIDAGWYELGADWFSAKGVGTWKPDPSRFRHGVREVADYVHRQGMKLTLWYEPERVFRGSFLWEKHPEWLLKWDEKSDNRLLNLGNPQAMQWLIHFMGDSVIEQGVDVLKTDFNVDPLEAWQNNDAPDRQGMTENAYVQGLLSYWDTLLLRNPRLILDTCASGGRRNDLETLRRTLPMDRSDYQAPSLGYPPVTADVFDSNQGFTYGLSLWIPYFGAGAYAEDVYSARSHLSPLIGVGLADLKHPDWDAFRRQVFDHRAVADCFYGDFYPLTPFSRAADVWMAWEFLLPDQGQGMIQAFRREFSVEAEARFKLQGLKREAHYEVIDLDTHRTIEASGRQLIEDGLHLEALVPRTALILTFKEVK